VRSVGESKERATDRAGSRLWLVSVVVGVGLGVFSQLADGIIGGRLFGLLGNIASPWGLAAFFVGTLIYFVRALASPAVRAFAASRVSESSAGRLADRPAPAWIFLNGRLSDLSSTAIRARLGR